MNKEEIYKMYPNLEAMNLRDLMFLGLELQKYPEDKDMLDAVKILINIIAKEDIAK